MSAIARKSLHTITRNSLCFQYQSHISCLSHFLSTFSAENTKKTPTLFNVNVVPQDFQFLIDTYHFSQQISSKISPFLKNPQRTHYVLDFLKQTGFSNSQLESIVIRNPQAASSLLKIVKSKIKCFQDFGFSSDEIVMIVANDPHILIRSASKMIIPSLSVLKGLLKSNAQIIKVTTKHGRWRRDLRKTLLPNIEFLKSCGVAEEQINASVRSCPYFLLLTPENVRRCAHKVDEMGVDRTSRLYIYALRVVNSMGDACWELKLKEFRDLGFSEDDIMRVFRSDPTVFAVSGQKIRKIKEVLLETGKYDLSSIRNCPTSFTRSVENRFKPRLQILKDLDKKGLLSKWPSLGTLATMTDNQFRMRFVALLCNEVKI